jgi:hypothetical protein
VISIDFILDIKRIDTRLLRLWGGSSERDIDVLCPQHDALNMQRDKFAIGKFERQQ